MPRKTTPRRPAPPARRAAPRPDPVAPDVRRQLQLEQMTARFDDHLREAGSADDAVALLSRMFGGLPYADKAELSTDGTAFKVTAAEFEPGRGYKGADRWNLAIVTKFGEVKALTLGQNATRNAFMSGLAKVVGKFGTTPWLCLQAVPFTDKATGDELTFYAVVLEAEWKAPDGAPVTIEG